LKFLLLSENKLSDLLDTMRCSAALLAHRAGIRHLLCCFVKAIVDRRSLVLVFKSFRFGLV
jgi:hypothetical protein